MDGTLTIRGTTRPVTLTAELGGQGDDPAEGRKVIGLSATTVIKRADSGFARNMPSAVTGDNVGIQLDIQVSLST